MEAIDALKQKVLSLAIQGKLVAQDPTDEPASVLLEKIKAEKAELVKQGKIKKDKQESYIFRGDDNKYYEKIGSETKDITDEIPFDIPENWEWVRLKNIVTIETGKKDANYGNPKGKYLFFTCAAEPIKCDNFSFSGESLILPGNGANVGLCIYYNGNFEAYQRTYVLQGYDNYLMYLKLVLDSCWKSYNAERMYGSAMPYIKLGNIEQFLAPLPPLSEQKRIVEEIEKIFGQIEVVKENQEELNKLKDGLKNKVLDLAIQGKLVEQDQNDEPASVLLEKIKAEKLELIKQGKIKKDKQESYIYKGADNRHYEKIGSEIKDITEEIPFDIPNNWSWVRLENITTYIQRGKSPQYTDIKEIPVISQKCVTKEGFNISPAKFIKSQSLNTYSNERFLINGDLLWNSTGTGTVGRVVIYSKDNNLYNIAVADSHVTVVRPLLICNQYLHYYLTSPLVQDGIEDICDGSTNQKELSLTTVKKYLIALPPINEQQRIVQKLSKVLKIICSL